MPNIRKLPVSKMSKLQIALLKTVHSFRLRNIQLAYNIPTEKLRISNVLRSAQVYVSAQNYLTITNYSWWDPEVNSSGGASSINQGIDFNTYPPSKSLNFGIRLGFKFKNYDYEIHISINIYSFPDNVM